MLSLPTSYSGAPCLVEVLLCTRFSTRAEALALLYDRGAGAGQGSDWPARPPGSCLQYSVRCLLSFTRTPTSPELCVHTPASSSSPRGGCRQPPVTEGSPRPTSGTTCPRSTQTGGSIGILTHNSNSQIFKDSRNAAEKVSPAAILHRDLFPSSPRELEVRQGARGLMGALPLAGSPSPPAGRLMRSLLVQEAPLKPLQEPSLDGLAAGAGRGGWAGCRQGLPQAPSFLARAMGLGQHCP